MNSLLVKLNTARDLTGRPDYEDLKRRDPWEKQIRALRSEIVKKYGGQNVTKAWLKMYELLSTTPLGAHLLSNMRPVRVFLNAEFPGGFLYAINHYLQTRGQVPEWVMSSFLPRDPTNKNFLGDELHIVEKYPARVLVGKIATNKGSFWSDGDLTNPKVPAILAQLARSKYPEYDLYTADGGFDVSGQENDQETLSIPLITGEVDTGVKVLGKGGNMVLKIFTFFTPEMRSLLVYLMRLFDQFDIIKPNTSGPLNSESYFVGIGFKGNPQSRQMLTPTVQEEQFLNAKMEKLVNTQINNIYQFFQGKSVPLNVNLELLALDRSKQL